jgi:hypothetical protein
MDTVCDFRIIFGKKTDCQSEYLVKAMKKERREVRNLLFLVTCASGFALLTVAALIYFWAPSKGYLARSILIAPETLVTQSFIEYRSLRESKTAFVFNKIEFTHKENKANGWGRFVVPLQAYKDFYLLIFSEKSISELTEEIVAQFTLSVPSSLTIVLKPEDQETFYHGGKICQQIQFAGRGGLFRVQMHPSQSSDVPTEEWVYFRYPGIYEQAVKLFADT